MISAAHSGIVQRCQQSCVYFLRNFAKTKHPSAGVLPFNPWGYQVGAIRAFRKHRFSIFKKVRQSGISCIAGKFALWYSMFFNHRKTLVVSRSDDTATEFLRENVTFTFDNLPQWMQELWQPVKKNEHELVFPNGSSITSLTSHPDVLRSHASSLNIVDEAAFIQDMPVMWAGGYPTLIHGGTVIVISTTNGVGNWYWNTWTDAEAGLNSFHPILVNWWDMDWTISYRDALSGEQRTICPTDGIRKCETPEDIQKWGPYYSPWLEEQWKGLQEKGEGWKFDQEILGRFIGSGRTIISQLALQYVESRISDKFSKVQNEQAYVHPVTGEGKKINLNVGEQHQLAAGDGLWVWRPPEKGKPPVIRAGHIVDPGMPGHRYIAGIDLMTGRGADYHAMEIFDVDTQEQAAEIMMHALPMEFKLVVDYLGRWYNNALLVIERNNGGDAFIDELRLSLMYPNLWRKKTPQDRPHKADGVKLKIAEYGFNTGGVSKEQLNQRLIDYIRADSATVRLYSRRLYKQLQIYVRLKDRAGRDTGKTGAEEGPGNHDDLVIASGLAFVGWPDAIQADSSGLVPFQEQMRQEEYKPPETAEQLLSRCAALAGPNFVMPMPGAPSNLGPMGIMEELERFTRQIGGVPISPQNLQLVSSRSANPYKR